MNDKSTPEITQQPEQPFHPDHAAETMAIIRTAGIWLCGFTTDTVELGAEVTLTDTYLLEIGIDHIWTPNGVAAQHGTSPTSLAVTPPEDDKKLNGVTWTCRVEGFRVVEGNERLALEGMIGALNTQAVRLHLAERAKRAGIAVAGPDAAEAAQNMSSLIANARGPSNRS